MTGYLNNIIVSSEVRCRPKGGIMNRWDTTRIRWLGFVLSMVLSLLPALSRGAEESKTTVPERRETLSLADAALQALRNNLDISISRQTKESRLFDITVEQAKFDPTLSVNGQYTRTVSPLNRPVFGGTGVNLTQIQTFDQRNVSVTVDATTNLLTGGNLDLNYSPAKTNVNQSVAQGFLFNPAYTGGLVMTLTQPLLRNAGIELTKTFITIA